MNTTNDYTHFEIYKNEEKLRERKLELELVRAHTEKKRLEYYFVEKKGAHHYAVVDKYGAEKTSAPSFPSAVKKAKLLEIGYCDCLDAMRDSY